MTKLSDTQALILSAAAQREDRNVLPLPGSLRGGAAAKVVAALIARGLIAETTIDSQTKADAALNRIWRNNADGRGILLHITDTGLVAIGVEPQGGDSAPSGVDEVPGTAAAKDAPAEAAPVEKATRRRSGTKQEAVIAMLRAEGGATIDEIMAVTNWAAHTARGFMAGALKKKLGMTITSEKIDGRGRIYRIEG
jgi:hypothetical protein